MPLHLKFSLAVAFLFILFGCDSMGRARIRPDSNLNSPAVNELVHADESKTYKIWASRLDGCCDVHLSVKNLGTKPLDLNPSQAKLKSSCEAPRSPERFKARAAGAMKPGEAPKINSSPLVVNQNETMDITFYFVGGWKKKCLPYKFELTDANGSSYAATFIELDLPSF